MGSGARDCHGNDHLYTWRRTRGCVRWAIQYHVEGSQLVGVTSLASLLPWGRETDKVCTLLQVMLWRLLTT
jgi:hypothetical protein